MLSVPRACARPRRPKWGARAGCPKRAPRAADPRSGVSVPTPCVPRARERRAEASFTRLAAFTSVDVRNKLPQTLCKLLLLGRAHLHNACQYHVVIGLRSPHANLYWLTVLNCEHNIYERRQCGPVEDVSTVLGLVHPLPWEQCRSRCAWSLYPDHSRSLNCKGACVTS